MAGLGGSLRLGNDVGPVGGADMGTLEYGLGGTRDADADARARSTAEAFSEAVTVLVVVWVVVLVVVAEAGGEGLLLAAEVAGDEDWSSLGLELLSSALSLASLVGAESGGVVGVVFVSTGTEVTMGELRDIALERKSV